MHSRFRLLAGLLACLAPLARANERTVTRDFQVGPSASLVLTLYRGGIVVRESDDAQIHVEATFSTVGEDDPKGADERLAREDLQTAQSGSTLTVNLPNPNKAGIKWDYQGDTEVSVAVIVTVPVHCNVSATTTDGSITLGNLAGAMTARCRVGTIFCKGIDGSVDAKVQTGDVIVSHASGPVILRTGRGDVRVGPVDGKATLKTDYGDIFIQQARGGVDASCESGSIAAGYPKAFAGESYLHADGGGITVSLPAEAHCSIDASSVWGHVQAEAKLPIKVESGSNGSGRLEGTLNDGGPRLVLRASGGHVKLLEGDSASTR